MVGVLWLYGADTVGKSTVGWEIYAQLTGQGAAMAFVDTDYLSFCSPSTDGAARLVERNLRAMWPNFVAAGARSLVVAGVVVSREERELFAAAIPDAVLTWCRLSASEEEIRARIKHRRMVEHPRDQPLGEDEIAELSAYGDRSVRFARHLESLEADVTVDTTGRGVADIAADVLSGASDFVAGARSASDVGIGTTAAG